MGHPYLGFVVESSYASNNWVGHALSIPYWLIGRLDLDLNQDRACEFGPMTRTFPFPSPFVSSNVIWLETGLFLRLIDFDLSSIAFSVANLGFESEKLMIL